MDQSRRQFVLMSLAALAAGCTSSPPLAGTSRPRPAWPTGQRPKQVAPPKPSPPRQIPAPPPKPPPSVRVGPVRAIPRSKWAKGNPIRRRLFPMRAVRRITVHHEGSSPVWFGDAPSTAERLEKIRQSHLKRLEAGDIGYHFVIDRAGRLWQGRSLKYQGAHVKNHNPYNVGIMCLGNFDLQRPTDRQLAALGRTLTQLMRRYRVSAKRVHTHQELMPTRCPGKALQGQMVGLRRGGRLG